jgi:hypothetical protein
VPDIGFWSAVLITRDATGRGRPADSRGGGSAARAPPP